MSGYGVSEKKLCSEDSIYKKITTLPGLSNNDCINKENITSILAECRAISRHALFILEPYISFSKARGGSVV